MCDKLVLVNSLKKYFHVGGHLFSKKYVRAVDDVSFDIIRGETLGLVGESGCGKSTLGRVILGLQEPTGGDVFFEGGDISKLSGKALKNTRKRMQMIFQDPSASLNPRRTVKAILEAPFRIHSMSEGEAREKEIARLLENVGLSDYHLSRYPHELSGGQKQRVCIARALALNPKMLVCDEAVSALDVSIQAQVINLLDDLRRNFSLTYLFISHNLSVVHYISDRVGVMYLGRIVEIGPKHSLFERPMHPYSRALISAIPEVGSGGEGRTILTGDVPNPADPPSGCGFRTRCPDAVKECGLKRPNLIEKEEGHFVACHLA